MVAKPLSLRMVEIPAGTLNRKCVSIQTDFVAEMLTDTLLGTQGVRWITEWARGRLHTRIQILLIVHVGQQTTFCISLLYPITYEDSIAYRRNRTA